MTLIKKDFSIYCHPEILEGKNKYKNLVKKIPKGRILLVTSEGFLKRKSFKNFLSQLGNIDFDILSDVKPNPDIDYLDKKKSYIGNKNYKTIIALGGGSVMDTAKALSVSSSSEENNLFSEFFRENRKYKIKRDLFLVAIPTTSGTGSEVTPFSTIWDFKNKKKYSLDGNFLFPDLVLLEPDFSLSLPFEQTLFPALDATSHALESIWNVNADKITKKIAIESLALIKASLPIALSDPKNLDSREKMQKASLLAGIAISKTKTAIAHSISYPLTNRFSVPHGIACSFTLVTIIDDLLKKNIRDFNEIKEINEIKKMLIDLNMNQYLYKYIDKKDILSSIEFMYSPERAKNFNQDITLKDVERIVNKSL